MIKELASLRGNHLDPALVDAFLPLAADLHGQWFAEDAVAEPRGEAAA